MERESYLLELCRYVVLNPVRAKMVRSTAHYRWSSYRATAGLGQIPPFLATGWVLAQFARRRGEAVKRYRSFIRQGVGGPSPWGQLKGQVLLGSEGFVDGLAHHFESARTIKEIPRRQRLANRPSLSALFEGEQAHSRVARNRCIRQAHLRHGYTLTEIGAYPGLHYSTVSKVVNEERRR